MFHRSVFNASQVPDTGNKQMPSRNKNLYVIWHMSLFEEIAKIKELSPCSFNTIFPKWRKGEISRDSPALLTSQMTTMAPRLASLRAINLPSPPPPPVTRAISPAMLFILYFIGMSDLTRLSTMANTVSNRNPITSPADFRKDMVECFRWTLYLLPSMDKRSPSRESSAIRGRRSIRIS